jgi:energy-coupling factor transport system permease protein
MTRLARLVHPVAWWIWAIGLATAASLTTNPLLLGSILAVAGIVVAARRTDAPWARAFRAYLVLGLVVVLIRVVFKIVLGATPVAGQHELVAFPELPLPGFMSGVTVGGPLTLESILYAVYDGMRLATLLCCVGAANTLANPKRALRSLPAALYELGVAITVAMTIAPQLVESAQRVRRARRLRGATTRGRRAVRGLAMPVLHDALTRSFALAAAMDSRGYGRTAGIPPRVRRATSTLMLAGLFGLCVGAYCLLDTTTPRWLGAPLFGAAALCAVAALALGGRRVQRTQYRPDPWLAAEWCTVACGAAAAVAMIVTAHTNPAVLDPSIAPLEWPTLAFLPVFGIALAALPAVLTPPPPAAAVDEWEPAPLVREGVAA